MQPSPPCPRCGQPLRWFPEPYAWGCDRCQQMMPAQPQAIPAVPLAAMPHAPVRTSRAGLWAVVALVVVGGGVATAVVLSGAGSGSAAGAGAASASGAAAGSASASAVAVEPPPPPVPSTGFPACDAVAVARAKIEACTSIPENIRRISLEMADNNLSAARDANPDGEYAAYLSSKCAGTAEALADTLSTYDCTPRTRAQASGYSVAIPPGWKVIHEQGQQPHELILEQRLPDLGAITVAGVLLELVPFSDKANATGTAENCTSFASYIARNQGATLDEHGLIATQVGPACLNRVSDGRERRLGMQVNVQGKHILGVTCTYDLGLAAPPSGCREIVDSLTLD